MIWSILKAGLAFCASYILLSFQFNNVSLYERINSFAGPVGQNIQTAIKQSLSTAWEKTKETSSQLFNNSAPVQALEDHVGKTQSALKKSVSPAIKNRVIHPANSYLDELRKEERDALSKLIEEDAL